MNAMSVRQVADLLAWIGGENASSIPLPADPARAVVGRSDLTPWEEWVEMFRRPRVAAAVIVQEVEGGEFLAYRLTVDGREATLVLFNWDQGGFDPVLVDGHAGSVAEAAKMWVGDRDPEEWGDLHPIHDLFPYGDDPALQGWVVAGDGDVTLCEDEEDARELAASWPDGGIRPRVMREWETMRIAYRGDARFESDRRRASGADAELE